MIVCTLKLYDVIHFKFNQSNLSQTMPHNAIKNDRKTVECLHGAIDKKIQNNALLFR